MDIVSKISGYLIKLNVDLGDAVKRGQILAEIHVPELRAEEDKAGVMVQLARARLDSATSAIQVAEASLDAEKAGAQAASAQLQGDEAQLTFREKSLTRIKELAARNAVEPRIVDQAMDGVETASSALNVSRARRAKAAANIIEAKAKLTAAKAELDGYKASVLIAEADFSKARALSSYAVITAPWDGVVTARNCHVADYVRSGDVAGAAPCLP